MTIQVTAGRKISLGPVNKQFAGTAATLAQANHI